jgi:hypothetical protein
MMRGAVARLDGRMIGSAGPRNGTQRELPPNPDNGSTEASPTERCSPNHSLPPVVKPAAAKKPSTLRPRDRVALAHRELLSPTKLPYPAIW